MKLNILLIIVVFLIGISTFTGGYQYYSKTKFIMVNDVKQQGDHNVLIIAKYLELYISKNLQFAQTLSTSPDLIDFLDHIDAPTMNRTNQTLDRAQAGLNLSVCYLMDANGKTIASSNRDSPKSFVGKNYMFRPYYKQAIQGSPSVYMALGITSKERGLYVSAPVYTDDNNKISGVVVLKARLTFLSDLMKSVKSGLLLLTSPDGVVFASNNDAFLFKLFWEPSVGLNNKLTQSRQFGKGPWPWVGFKRFDENHIIDQNKNLYSFHQMAIMNYPRWHIICLYNMTKLNETYFHQILDMSHLAGLSFFILIGLLALIIQKMIQNEIKKRKAFEASLKENNEMLSKMTGAANDAIIMIDNKCAITLWNRAAEKMFCFSEKEALDTRLDSLIIPQKYQADHKKGFGHFRNTGRGPLLGKALEISGKKKNGTEFPIEISLSAVQIKQKWCAIGIIRDLSERKKMEHRIIQKEKESALSTLVAGIAHEMNNPMMGVLNYIQYCLKNTKEGDKRYTILKDAEQEIKRCVEILENLLTFTYYEKQGDEEFSSPIFSEVFKRVISILNHQLKIEKIDFEVSIPDMIPAVRIKVSCIQQVFVNLIQNAIEAVKDQEQRKIHIKVTVDIKTVKTTVSDNGKGIEKENLQKIFDPFFTTKSNWQSTGLGLATCRNIINEHGGEITCKSELGKGTSFEVLLPWH